MAGPNTPYFYRSGSGGGSTGLTNPMTSGADMIYGGISGTPTRLANGSLNQMLTSAGGSAAPTWALAPGSFYWSGFYQTSTANFWSTTATAGFTQIQPSGVIPSPTAMNTANWNTVQKAISSFPGINFQAPRTGTLKIKAQPSVIGSNSLAATAWQLELLETTTGSTLLAIACGESPGGTGSIGINTQYPVPLEGYFPTTIGATYNFVLYGVVGAGTMFIGAESSAQPALTFTLEYIS